VKFTAAWFAKAAACAFVALVVGFVGSLYVGIRLLQPVDETTKLEMRSNQSIAAQAKPYLRRENGNARAQGETEGPAASEVVHSPVTATHAATAPGPPSPAKRDVTEPEAKQALRDTAVTDNEEELRLGQQERRRLRAARRKSLENANASFPRGGKKAPPQVAGDEPFFPFRF